VLVVETFQGSTVWKGEVEVFSLTGHPKASKGYAWAFDKAKGSEVIAVLELPPVISPQTAVHAAIGRRTKREQARKKLEQARNAKALRTLIHDTLQGLELPLDDDDTDRIDP
jgi:hypothetical protein